ncbi:MAG: ATP-dependent Clp protease ATP-binding subunit ClpA, partial [bacterium]
KQAIEKTFSPEFRNRLDATIMFGSLSQEIIKQVVEKFINELRKQLVDKKVTLELTEVAKEWLAKKGFDKLYGARPMARLIQVEVKEQLAEEILFGTLQNGGLAVIDLQDNKIKVNSSKKVDEKPVEKADEKIVDAEKPVKVDKRRKKILTKEE